MNRIKYLWTYARHIPLTFSFLIISIIKQIACPWSVLSVCKLSIVFCFWGFCYNKPLVSSIPSFYLTNIFIEHQRHSVLQRLFQDHWESASFKEMHNCTKAKSISDMYFWYPRSFTRTWVQNFFQLWMHFIHFPFSSNDGTDSIDMIGIVSSVCGTN